MSSNKGRQLMKNMEAKEKRDIEKIEGKCHKCKELEAKLKQACARCQQLEEAWYKHLPEVQIPVFDCELCPSYDPFGKDTGQKALEDIRDYIQKHPKHDAPQHPMIAIADKALKATDGVV